MPETRNIVILGASYAGIGATHYFLKHVYPTLPSGSDIEYKTILVDPTKQWYQRTASPRAVASPDLLPVEKIFQEIEPGFKQYGDAFTFIHGSAKSWDDKRRTVTIQRIGGAEETVSYHALILATGSKTNSPIFSLQGTEHTDVQAALRKLHEHLAEAKRIVIVGGGPSGVETAGELGDALNGSPGWLGPANRKVDITLITSASRLLPILRPVVAKQAEAYLKRVGVNIRFNTKTSSTSTLSSGKTLIQLHDGEEIEADLYIPAMGVQPMSDYVPAHLKDSKGYVIQNNETLRVDAAGPRVYAVGDIGTYSRNGIPDILYGVPVMETNLKRDLHAAHEDINAKPVGKDRIYVPSDKATQLVPIGRSKGVGELFGWQIPSLLVWMIKGRDYMVPKGKETIVGNTWAKESPWKGE